MRLVNLKMTNSIAILGIRGIPAQHGGFETFAEHLATYLKQKRWEVTVYCQEKGSGENYEDFWQGIHRVHIPVALKGAKGTILFDWKATLHAVKRKVPTLTLGYNTALFCMMYRLSGVKNIINMDGIEWRRDKWDFFEKTWLYVNEKLGAWLGNHLIADHPEIRKRLAKFIPADKITVIPYSTDMADRIDVRYLAPFGLKRNEYALLIARPEPENSILEIVKAYSRKTRGIPLVILGEYYPRSNHYQRKVIDAAGNEVEFIGAIYDKAIVQSLRHFARFYIHGHTVGGTNPSLIEALGAGSAVLAHDNKFNRWVAGEGALYFSTEKECAEHIEILMIDDDLITEMRKQSSCHFRNYFTWDKVYPVYEKVLLENCYEYDFIKKLY